MEDQDESSSENWGDRLGSNPRHPDSIRRSTAELLSPHIIDWVSSDQFRRGLPANGLLILPYSPEPCKGTRSAKEHIWLDRRPCKEVFPVGNYSPGRPGHSYRVCPGLRPRRNLRVRSSHRHRCGSCRTPSRRHSNGTPSRHAQRVVYETAYAGDVPQEPLGRRERIDHGSRKPLCRLP